MSQPLYPPAGPLSIGRVLDLSFRIFQMSLVSCLLYGALSMIAGQLPNIYFIATGRPLRSFGGGSLEWLVLYFVGSIITLTLTAALLVRQHSIATGQRTSASIELSRAVRALPAYLGIMLLVIAIVAVPVILIGIFARLSGGGFQGAIPQGPAAIALTIIAVIVAIYFATPLVFTPAAVMLDRKGPWGALRYVVRLVRGSWWRTTAVLTIALVLIIVFYGVGMVIVGMILPLAGMTDVASVSATIGVVYVVMGSLGLPFFYAVLLASYGDLKVRREGLDLEQRVAGIAPT